MFRKILLSTVFVAAATSSFAADLPYRTAAPAPYAAAIPMFTWTGFYVGLNAGAAFNGNRGFSSTGFTSPNPVIYSGSNGNRTSFTGGAEAGYNMQFGSFVAGIEADINYLQRNRGGSSVVPANGPGGPTTPASYYYFGANQGSSSNYFGTVRGRLGYAFDRILFFGTGGLAYGGRGGNGTVDQYNVNYNPPVTTTTNNVTTTTPGFYSPATRTTLATTNNSNSSNFGYALGGGMEYAFSNSMSFKIEYLHVKLGNNNRTYVPTTGTPNNSFISARNDNKFDVVRAGVNFRF